MVPSELRNVTTKFHTSGGVDGTTPQGQIFGYMDVTLAQTLSRCEDISEHLYGHDISVI